MNSIISNLKLYSSFMLKVLKFKTSNEWAFLVFGRSNVKYLIFDTFIFNMWGTMLMLYDYSSWIYSNLWGYIWKATKGSLDLKWEIGTWINEKKS